MLAAGARRAAHADGAVGRSKSSTPRRASRSPRGCISRTAAAGRCELRVAGLNQFADHFYIDGKITLPLRVGQYTFELEAGPEYRTQNGHFEIERHADDSKRIEMHRFADLAKEGWWAGDLDVDAAGGRLAAGDAGGVARLCAESRRPG